MCAYILDFGRTASEPVGTWIISDQDKEGKEKKGDGEEDNREEEPGELSDESYSDDGDYNEFSMKFSMLIHMISAFVIPF
ncbi:Uncharacterized protein TCM_028913 [Theobroma cacao]|uniref:Uncharacterized protein n=1 Tax=Theobroma cacao TaxID=3641 RepID=A0A061GIR1_THECC|nr:Uncharacterized protein TCM_028913 [Theobroma cacao]